MKLFRINSLGSMLRALVAWPLVIAGLYCAAAMIGSVIPVNADWRAPTSGNVLYLYDNGVHTSLIIPRNGDGFDLGYLVADPPLAPEIVTDSPTDVYRTFPMAMPDNRFPGAAADYPYLMFGWGDARFYRETPRWADVRPGTVMAALFGSGETLVHVDRLPRLPYRGLKKLILRDQEYAELLPFLVAQFPDQRMERAMPTPGYGPDDRFYPISTSELHYSAFFTCNNWVSEALKRAGVRTGYWTPLPFGVMWWH